MTNYPSRKETLMGLLAQRPLLAKVSEAFETPSEVLPIKYPVILVDNRTNVIVQGHVTSHLELSDWCWLKNYTLFALNGTPELALPDERTSLT